MFSTFVTSAAAVPGWTFSKCPAERKAVAVMPNVFSGSANFNRATLKLSIDLNKIK